MLWLTYWHCNCSNLLSLTLGLCFYSRQLSVVEYDPGTHDLKTLSLHYFEEPELRVGRNIDDDEMSAHAVVDVYKHRWMSFSVIWTLVQLSGRLCTKCTYPHRPRGSRESLCSDAHLRHQTGGPAVQKGHSDWWAGGRSWRRVCLRSPIRSSSFISSCCKVFSNICVTTLNTTLSVFPRLQT